MENDRSIYIIELGIGGIIIITYIDNFLLIGPRINEINILKEKLSSIFSMKDLGPCETFLGIHLIRDRKNHLIHLVQDHYTDKVLETFGLQNATPI
jgi:hypothetical protein